MTKYKIIEIKNGLGEKHFNIKERFLFLFWINYNGEWESLKSAKEFIDNMIERKRLNKTKVIKKHKYNGPSR